MLPRAELDDRACTTFKRFIAGFAELLEFKKLIITMLIGFPFQVTEGTDCVTVLKIVACCFVRPAEVVAAV